MRRRMRYFAIIFLAALLSGCALFANQPMEVLTYEHPDKAVANQRLFVFMRGIGGSHHTFEEEGLVADVWERGLPFDMVAPNAHIGYYGDRNLIQRLKKDVIDPARARGCKEIWLIGVSMGGLGSMLYLREHPEDIAGVYLISPFLGTPIFLAEIEIAGGVRQWNPGPYLAELDWQRMLWHWMKTSIADHPDKIIYLGYGSDDPYKGGQELMATLLPPERVTVIDGAHDYRTLKALWKIFLEHDDKLKKLKTGGDDADRI
ncbi:MAG: alpha/beta hydrolase [Deltaproteobacteria bacterium]